MSGIATDSAVTTASSNAEVDALLWDRHWSHNNLTFSFPTSVNTYAYGAQNFAPLLSQQMTAVNEVLAQYSAVCGVTFAGVAAGDPANLRFARASATDDDLNGNYSASEAVGTAYGIPPSDQYAERRWGEMWFNTSPPGGTNDMTNPIKGNYAYHTIMHEIGHVMGFDHPHGDAGIGNHFGNLASQWDSMEFTVMTYRSYVGGPTTGGYSNAASSYAQSLMVLDINALQYLYGANYSTNNGDTTYTFNPTTGAMAINGVAENASTAPSGNVIFRTIWDGGGNDTYDFSNYATNLQVDLRAASTTETNVGWIILDTSAAHAQRADLGDGNFAGFNIANSRLFNGDVRSLIENATGGSGNDTLIGNNAANTLSGGAGNDTLFGNDGPDRFEGGSGADAMFGGNGIDQAQYTFATSGVTVDLLFSGLNTGDAAGDTFDSIENLRGSNFDDILRGDDGDNALGGWFGGGNDTLVGRGGNDTLAGGDGNDVLIGGDGIDSYDGGTGDDLYYVQDTLGTELVFENADSGHDTVNSTVRWVLGANFEDLVLSGTENINGFGNELNNQITGNSGNNYLQGFVGVDSLAGGLGNDYYELGDLNQANQFSLFAYDSVTEGAGAGIDTVSVTAIQNPDRVSTSGYTLGANIENGIIQGNLAFNLTGNELANELTGNSAVNTLTGGEGGDTYFLTSLARSNIFEIFHYDTVNETGSTGIDTVVVTAVDNPDTFSSTESYTLGANIENGIIRGDLAFNLTGNLLANELTGNSAVNTLTGGEGGDTYFLTSLARSNIFEIFHYDTVNETGSTGIDTVVVTAVDNPDTFSSTESYTLGATIENGTIAGTIDFNLTGNGLDNVLTGNSAMNILTGGLGDDTYVLNDTTMPNIFSVSRYDTVVEDANAGIDTVIVNSAAPSTSIRPSYTLGGNIENGIISGAFDFRLLGNSLGNELTGNDQANALNGFGGRDHITGGGGADGLFGGNGKDFFIFTALTDSGISKGDRDTIRDFSGRDRIDVSAIDANLELDGDQAFVLDTDGLAAAGEISFKQIGNNLMVNFYTNGDPSADMKILMLNTAELTAADFIL